MSEKINKVLQLAKSFSAGFPGMSGAGATGIGAIAKPHMAPGVKKSGVSDQLGDQMYKLKDGRDGILDKKSGGNHLQNMKKLMQPKMPSLPSKPMLPRQKNTTTNSEV